MKPVESHWAVTAVIDRSAINEGRATDSNVSLRIITNAETTSTAISGAAPAGAGGRSRAAGAWAPRAGRSPVGVGLLVVRAAAGDRQQRLVEDHHERGDHQHRDQRGGAGGCGGAVSVCGALCSEGGEFSGGCGRTGAHVGGGGFLPRGPGRPGPGPRGGRVTLRGVGGLRPRPRRSFHAGAFSSR